MKTRILQFTILILLLVSSLVVVGQSTTDNNVPAGNKFLGYNAGGIDLDFKTNNITRMRLMQSNINTVDNYTFLCSGFLGMSIDPNFFTQSKPFSLLHLHGLNNPSVSQPWG